MSLHLVILLEATDQSILINVACAVLKLNYHIRQMNSFVKLFLDIILQPQKFPQITNTMSPEQIDQ